METFIYIALAVMAGFLIGWHVHASVFTHIMREMLEVFGISEADMIRALNKMKKQQEDNVCNIRVEQDEAGMRAYRVHDDMFLAQADNAEELVDRIISKVGKGVYVQCLIENGGDIFREQAEKYQKNLH